MLETALEEKGIGAVGGGGSFTVEDDVLAGFRMLADDAHFDGSAFSGSFWLGEDFQSAGESDGIDIIGLFERTEIAVMDNVRPEAAGGSGDRFAVSRMITEKPRQTQIAQGVGDGDCAQIGAFGNGGHAGFGGGLGEYFGRLRYFRF